MGSDSIQGATNVHKWRFNSEVGIFFVTIGQVGDMIVPLRRQLKEGEESRALTPAKIKLFYVIIAY